MAAPCHDQIPEPLRYQTLALKVSIHCEGCKKKVMKVLQSIEGVYKISIDSQLHKVIVRGNMEVETLVKKLLKSGKQAELWPEPRQEKNNTGDTVGPGSVKKSRSKNKNKNNGDPNEPPSEINPHESNPDDSSNGATQAAVVEPSPPPPEKHNAGDQKVLVVATPALALAPASGGGNGRKKKKKKKNNHNHQQNNSAVGAAAAGGAVVQVLQQDMAEAGAGGGNAYGMQPSFDYPAPRNSPLPKYVVSYSAVEPNAGYGGAHYMAQQDRRVYSAATPGSYYIFSEENANACCIM